MGMPHCDVFDELYGDVLSDIMYKKGDIAGLAHCLVTASQQSSHDHIRHLRETKGFNPNLFWSWDEAAIEQVSQYQRCIDRVQFKSRCFNVVVRNLLVVASITSMFLATLLFGH